MRLVCADKSLVDGPGYLSEEGSYNVGRSRKCKFRLNDLSVSRFHAEVIVDQDKVRVRDLGSRNGTFVDGVRIAEADLQPGQSVRFGSAQFHLVDDAIPGGANHESSEVSTFYLKYGPTAGVAMLTQLSQAQQRVLEFLLDGLQEKQVASKLAISPNTVHNHIKRIYSKLGVCSRGELLALFIKEKKGEL